MKSCTSCKISKPLDEYKTLKKDGTLSKRVLKVCTQCKSDPPVRAPHTCKNCQTEGTNFRNSKSVNCIDCTIIRIVSYGTQHFLAKGSEAFLRGKFPAAIVSTPGTQVQAEAVERTQHTQSERVPLIIEEKERHETEGKGWALLLTVPTDDHTTVLSTQEERYTDAEMDTQQGHLQIDPVTGRRVGYLIQVQIGQVDLEYFNPDVVNEKHTTKKWKNRNDLPYKMIQLHCQNGCMAKVFEHFGVWALPDMFLSYYTCHPDIGGFVCRFEERSKPCSEENAKLYWSITDRSKPIICCVLHETYIGNERVYHADILCEQMDLAADNFSCVSFDRTTGEFFTGMENLCVMGTPLTEQKQAVDLDTWSMVPYAKIKICGNPSTLTKADTLAVDEKFNYYTNDVYHSKISSNAYEHTIHHAQSEAQIQHQFLTLLDTPDKLGIGLSVHSWGIDAYWNGVIVEFKAPRVLLEMKHVRQAGIYAACTWANRYAVTNGRRTILVKIKKRGHKIVYWNKTRSISLAQNVDLIRRFGTERRYLDTQCSVRANAI